MASLQEFLMQVGMNSCPGAWPHALLVLGGEKKIIQNMYEINVGTVVYVHGGRYQEIGIYTIFINLLNHHCQTRMMYHTLKLYQTTKLNGFDINM